MAPIRHFNADTDSFLFIESIMIVVRLCVIYGCRTRCVGVSVYLQWNDHAVGHKLPNCVPFLTCHFSVRRQIYFAFWCVLNAGSGGMFHQPMASWRCEWQLFFGGIVIAALEIANGSNFYLLISVLFHLFPTRFSIFCCLWSNSFNQTGKNYKLAFFLLLRLSILDEQKELRKLKHFLLRLKCRQK